MRDLGTLGETFRPNQGNLMPSQDVLILIAVAVFMAVVYNKTKKAKEKAMDEVLELKGKVKRLEREIAELKGEE